MNTQTAIGPKLFLDITISFENLDISIFHNKSGVVVLAYNELIITNTYLRCIKQDYRPYPFLK